MFLGIVALTLSGCPQPSPQGPTAGAFFPACSTADLMNKVRFLQTPFDPRVNSSPQPSGIAVPANIQGDMQNAFAIAPPAFKAKLCNMTYIFIDPTGCADPLNCALPDAQVALNSWGLRGYRSGDTGKYIATSAALWQGGGSAPKLGDYEFRRFRAVLQRLNPNGANWIRMPNAPRTAGATPDTPAMTVLAVLAHETGHVFWYDAFVPQRGGAINLNNFCNGNFYASGSWSNINVPAGRWIDFAQPSATATRTPDLVSSLNSHLSQNRFVEAGATLQAILQNQNFASLLAAFSPDEDFVEAYQWYVLLNAATPATALTIQIPGLPPHDIAAGIANKPALRNKMACFS
jgi:hypothetical protein